MTITDPDVRAFKRYLRELEKRLVEVDQRVARVLMHGKVAKVRKQGNDWQVMLELGRDPETNQPVESPWVMSSGRLRMSVAARMARPTFRRSR